jgi:hypothetical protein
MFSYFFVLMGFFTHLMPHPWWGFTAVGASLLFFGARRSPKLFVLPVLILAASDYYLTAFAYNFPFHVQFYLVTWGWYLAACWIGWALLRKQVSAGRVVAASAASATSFFLVSNFVSCVGSTFYPHTLTGLTAAYLAGLPFFRNDLVSTTLLASAVFGVPVLARRMADEWQRRTLGGVNGAGPNAA